MFQENSLVNRAGLGLALAFCLFAPQAIEASKRSRQLSDQEICGAWIGVSEDELYLFRVVLSEDKTGRGGYIFRGSEPVTFDILSWSNGRRFTMEIEFHDEEERNFSKLIFGKIISSDMAIEVSGKGWKRSVELRLEGPLVNDWRQLAAATGFLFPIEIPDPQRPSARPQQP